jgi:hypothetical protein
VKYKYILTTWGHDYLDTDVLALRAAQSLEKSVYKDCIYQYGETIYMYAKRNKTSISVRQIK